MRIIVYGIGAIGGTIAAALALAGQEVIGIARGPQLNAIRANGLLLRTPGNSARARFACVSDPSEIEFRPDDAILLTMKSQDTVAALERLRVASVCEQPVFCVQNGVANERFALRRFPNVHGATVILPANFMVPGEVTAFGSPRHGIFDIGRYPEGSNDHDERLATSLRCANIAAFISNDVMQSKYGKLLMNLNNIVEAALGPGSPDGCIAQLLREEAEVVFKAAGIAWREVGAADPRRAELMRPQRISGVARSGNSSAQSLARGSGSIETDYLNGEIVLLGRLHGIPVPANAFFVELSARMVRENVKPGTISAAQMKALLSDRGVVIKPR